MAAAADATNDRSYSDSEESEESEEELASHKCIDCQIVFYEGEDISKLYYEDNDIWGEREAYICGDC